MNLLGLMGKIKVNCLMNQIKGLESDRYKPEETKKGQNGRVQKDLLIWKIVMLINTFLLIQHLLLVSYNVISIYRKLCLEKVATCNSHPTRKLTESLS